MPSYTPSQKAAIAQFVGFTQAKDSVAAKVSRCQQLTTRAYRTHFLSLALTSLVLGLHRNGKIDGADSMHLAATQKPWVERRASNRRVRIFRFQTLLLQHTVYVSIVILWSMEALLLSLATGPGSSTAESQMSLPSAKGNKSWVARNADDDEVARVVRESHLHEARASLERNIAQIQKAYGEEPDDEEVARQLLSIENTRPFNYSLASVMEQHEIPVLGGHPSRPSTLSYREKLTCLFSKWCRNAASKTGPRNSHGLPSMFRFALQRPLMPESKLQKTLEEFGIDPRLNFLSKMRVEFTTPQGRTRRTIYGLDPNLSYHVSSKYRNVFPRGLSLLNEGCRQPKKVAIGQDMHRRPRSFGTLTGWESGLNHQNKEWGERELRECLWSLYDLIQDGLIDPEQAPDRYRDVMDMSDLSNTELKLHLGNLGLPDHQIQNANFGRSQSPDHTSEETDTITKIEKLVELYTLSGHRAAEVAHLIKETLVSLPIDIPDLVDLIMDPSGDAAAIAEDIWEETPEMAAARARDTRTANNEDLSTQDVSEEFADVCDEVLRAGASAEDAIAMLKAAMDEDELTSAEKSYIAAYRRLFLSNTDKTEDSDKSCTALGVPVTTVGPGAQDDCRQYSQALDVRRLPSVVSLVGLANDDRPRSPLPEQKDLKVPSIDGHAEQDLTSSVIEDATDTVTADGSRDTTQVNALDKHSDMHSAIDTESRVSTKVPSSCGAPTGIMSPPAYSIPLTKPMHRLAGMPTSLTERSETPIPQSVHSIAASRKPDRQKPICSAWKEYVRGDEMYEREYLSTSPETGTTSDMFGLRLPTNKARELGARIGLPSDYIQEQIHSQTAVRMKKRKFIKASGHITFPARKRKASNTTDGSQRDKLPKHRAVSDLFAQDDEDHEEFIHGYFTPEVLQESKLRCSTCCRLQCACRKRKRSSSSQSRERPSSHALVSNEKPESGKQLRSRSSASSSSLRTVGVEKPETTSASVPSLTPVKLRLNPPKPLGQSNPSSLRNPPTPSSRSTPLSLQLSEISKSKRKEQTRTSRSAHASAPCFERAPESIATTALTTEASTRNVKQKRSGRGFQPWPGRGITRKAAVEKAHEEAVKQRKSIFLYMAERRLIRPQANQEDSDRFFQSSSRTSNGSGTTSSLNKLFDKYRGSRGTFDLQGT